jgi:hypothetical protein
MQRALVSDCGSAALLADASGLTATGNAPAIQVGFAGNPPVVRDHIRGANLDQWPTPNPPGIDLIVDPATGRFLFDTGASPPTDLRVRYRTGMATSVGAGGYTRATDSRPPSVHWQNQSSAAGTPANGIAEIDDSTTFTNLPDQAALIFTVVRAAAGQRPYLRLQADWLLTAAGSDRSVTLDGLWIGSRPAGHVVLDGDFATVTLRNCTLDPGGHDAMGAVLPPCELIVNGTIDELVIDHCILPSVLTQGAVAAIDQITITDSIIDASQAGAHGLLAPRAQLTIARSTIVAPAIDQLCLHVEKIDATDTLVAGFAEVTDQQNGCFRFSARGTGSFVPHPYESHSLDDLERIFASRRFGDPEYMTLSPRADGFLLTGSEQGSELGAFCSEIRPIKFASLRRKVEEYMPFGRLPAYIMEN